MITVKKILIALILFFWAFATPANAQVLGEAKKFFVEQKYDKEGRSELTATLVKVSGNVYFYVDKEWWSSQTQSNQSAVLTSLDSLSNEFSNKIYPVLTSTFGFEWNPGIDKDSRITILLQDMNSDDGGYFKSSDEYSKLQITDSNEREMVYLNLSYLQNPWLKNFLAHELMHLISFNQKENKYGVSEDVWLEEARAEYVSTMLGYDDVYSGSYLEKRVQYFSERPTGSLVDWQETKYDYARVDLFANYLVDQYGIKILADSLKSGLTGVDSVNYVLHQNGVKDDLLQIFSNWTVAVLINNCGQGPEYCYSEKNLKNFYLAPQVNFLPIFGESTLTFADKTRYWSGNWYKIIGGGGGLMKFNFVGDPATKFKVYYITKNNSGVYSINSIQLNDTQKGNISINNFGSDISSLYIIPVLTDGQKIKDNLLHSFSWSASITRPVAFPETENHDPNQISAEIQQLLARIADLKKQIADILAQKSGGAVQTVCQLTSNLYQGTGNGEQVKCLQNFLKSQGDGIYPEGYVTGNFGSLTKKAVIKFQAKYGIPQTGFVGTMTRNKINQIISGF